MTNDDNSQKMSQPQNEDKFRLLFDGTADALFLHDLEGRFVEVNQAACDSLGYTREELLQQNVLDIEVGITPEAVTEMLARILQGEKITWEGLNRRKDGATFPVEVHLSLFEYAGRPHILASARDITERLRAEEALRTSESFLNSIIDQSPCPMWISDDQGTLIRLNQACRDLLHIADAEVLGKYNILQDNIIEEQGLLPLVRRVFEKGETVRFEIKYDSSQLKHLQLRHAASVVLDVTIFPIRDASGVITNVVIQHMDITDRKRAEAALAESEQRFSTFMAHLPAAVFIKDQAGRLVFANRYLRETFGWEDCLGKTTAELLPPEFAARMVEDDRRALTEGPIVVQEGIVDTQGIERYFDTYKFPVKAEGASLLEGGIAIDVTERKRAVEALELSEKKYRSFYESILDGFASVDLDGNIIETNQAYLEMIGYTAEEVRGLRYQDLTPAKWHKFEADIIDQQVLTRGYSDTYQKEYIRKDGAVFPVELRAYLLKDKAGAAADMWAFVRDITTLKQGEEALRESEERYRSLFQNHHSVMLLIEPETGAIMDANPAACAYYGFSKEELLTKKATDINTLPPEQILQEMQRAKTEKRKRFEFQHRLANGEVREVEVFSGPIRIKGQELLYSIVHDVTARKQAEEALRANQEYLRSVMESVGAGIVVIDAETRQIVDINPFAEKIIGVPRKEIIGKTCHEHICPAETCKCPVLDLGLNVDQSERLLLTGHGQTIPILKTVTRFQKEGREYLLESFLDITARKQAEEALRESEARFRQVVESSPLPIGLAIADGKIEYVNPKFVETFGYTLEDVPQLADWFRLAYPDPAYRQSIISQWEESVDKITLQEGTPEEVEVEIVCKDGSKRNMQIFGSLMGDRILTVFNDLTERKRIEEALEKRLVALSRPLDDAADIDFHDLFNLNDIQRIQDLFAKSTGVASLITAPDGTPITQPSNFCRLCSDFIRQTELGREKCAASDAALGRYSPDAPTIQHCLSAGLCGAGTSITVGGKHIANWLIGQVRNETINEESLRDYARAVGANAEEFIAAFREVPTMSADQFQQVAQALFVLANQLSAMAYQNVQQARFITERKQAEAQLLAIQERLELALQGADLGTWDWNVKTGALTFNKRWAEMLGYTLEEVEPHLHFWERLVHPDELPAVVEILNAHLEGQTPFYETEHRLRHKSGEWVWVLDKGKVIERDPQGKAVRACGTHLDITERKRAEVALRDSEERLRLALQAANQGLYDLNIQTGEAKVSPEYATMLGYDPGEFQETNARWIERLHPDDREQVAATYQAYVRGDIPNYEVEFRQRTQSGDWKWILSMGKVVACDEDGKPLRMLGTHTDITERKNAEDALRESEKQLREAQEMAHLGFWYWNVRTGDVTWSEEVYKIFQLDPKEFTPRIDSILELSPWPEDHERDKYLIRKALESHEKGAFEQRFLLPDKSIGHYYSTFQGKYDDEGNLIFIVGTVLDISERKQAEEALRTSERRLSDIIDFLPDATFAIDLEGKVIAWNRAIEEMTGVKAEAIIGKGDYAYALPFYGVRRPILIDLTLMSSEEIEQKYVFVQRQGDILLAEAHVPVRGENRLLWGKARLLYNSEGKVIGALETIRDITEHKQAEEALRESETRFRQAVEHSPLAIAILSGDQGEYLNPRFIETLGYTLEDIPSLPDWFRLAYPDPAYRQSIIDKWQKSLEEAMAGDRGIRGLEVEVTCKDGSVRTMDICGVLVGSKILVFCNDLTERLRAEEERTKLETQMREVQKLESLGVLAGGIAHDFNNLLMSILGNADLALLALSPASPARSNVEEITRASQRAADLCRQMLAYSGKGRFVVGRYDLSEIVQEMAQMLKVSVSKKASLRYSFATDLPAVEVDATQMRQVIMNLITNASEATEETGGVISISTGVTDCDRDYLSESYLDENLPEGRYVFLEVADTGYGMDEETRRRIFDPFYTTKFTGRGLGLAAVLGIVRGHRGAIKVYSEPGKGTIFKILLPAVAWEAGDRVQAAAPAAAPHYQGTILLIDDDPHVRRVAEEMLGRLGLRVLTAAQGQEGLEIFRAKGGEIDCILLDLTMPGMGGEEAFQELRRLRRDVRVVLSSGYDEQDATQQFVGKGLAGFIQKPYTVAKLQEVLNRVLSQ